MNELDTRTAHTCKRPDCNLPSRARGMCPRHYLQWNRVMAKKREAEGTRQPKSFRSLVFAALPGAMTDIAEKTGIGRRTAQKWLCVFKAEKVVRIIDWRRPATTGAFVPIYGAGSGPDAVCKLVAYYATSQTAWKRRKACMSDEQRDVMRNKARTRKQQKAAAKNGDPLVLALFGSRAIQQGGQP